MSSSILLVEDDARLAALLSELLQQEGYRVSIEPRGDAAVGRIQSEAPELVVLDINLPGMDGLSICRAVRAAYGGRILIVTARGEELDEILGLELGADDYLAKPVSPRLLLARVRALLRRPGRATNAPIRNGALIIDPQRRRVELDGAVVVLKTAEFDLLWLLARRLGEVVSRDEMHRALRGGDYNGLDRSIDLRISRLRRYLGDDPRSPRWIKTVHGAGYLLARA